MNQVRLGRTGLTTSSLGLGTHALHRLLSTSARQRLLATAFDLGFRYFDTAPSYGGGLAEREIGAFAATRRSQLVLTTKFGIYSGRLAALPPYVTAALRMASRLVRGGRGAGGPPPRDYDPDRARVSLENSLRALRTDHVDVLYLHEPELALLGDCDRLARALESFRASGKVRYFGLSGQAAENTRIASACAPIAEVIQSELKAGPDGLPLASPTSAAPSAVLFWESRGGAALPAAVVGTILDRARAASPEALLMLSTPGQAQIEQFAAAAAHR